jgi:hypothetical protein
VRSGKESFVSNLAEFSQVVLVSSQFKPIPFSWIKFLVG